MAASVCTRILVPFVPGAGRITVTEFLFSTSYPNTGGTIGEPMTASDLGLTTVDFAIATVKTAGTGSVISVFYDVSGKVLRAYAAAAQIANGTDLSAITATITAFGK